MLHFGLEKVNSFKKLFFSTRLPQICVAKESANAITLNFSQNVNKNKLKVGKFQSPRLSGFPAIKKTVTWVEAGRVYVHFVLIIIFVCTYKFPT